MPEKTYSVSLELPVNIRIAAVSAESHEAAIKKAMQEIYDKRYLLAREFGKYPDDMFKGEQRILGFELGESPMISALVDEEGDEEYENSAWYESHPQNGDIVIPMQENLVNPLHKFRGQWYFWDETWTNRMGPYSDRLAASMSLYRYSCILNNVCHACGADLSKKCAIERHYINKDAGADAGEETDAVGFGHYVSGNFEPDISAYLADGRYDLADDSDRCSDCKQRM